VMAMNLGKDAWTERARVRLGAAAGCPAAWATNDWTWDDPGAQKGYVTSVTDARAFLDATASVAQGDGATVLVSLTAPGTPGKKRLGVRMVGEDVAWFGAPAGVDVDVTSTGADAGVDMDASVAAGGLLGDGGAGGGPEPPGAPAGGTIGGTT